MSTLRDALSVLLPLMRPRILHFLRRRFPRVCSGLLEDALQDALCQIARDLGDPTSTSELAWARHGADGLRRVSCCYAWRATRGRLRRKGYHWVSTDLQFGGPPQPDELLIARRAANRLGPVLLLVSRRHAPRAPGALLAALHDSLGGDETDGQIAARHGLRREPLCRARSEARALLAA